MTYCYRRGRLAETIQKEDDVKKFDKFGLMEMLRSAIERDEATSEYCERTEQKENPQVKKMAIETEARKEFAEAVLRAIELGDYTDLRTFTKKS